MTKRILYYWDSVNNWDLTLQNISDARDVINIYALFTGGGPGERGLNLLIRRDGRTINLGPKTAVAVQPGVSA